MPTATPGPSPRAWGLHRTRLVRVFGTSGPSPRAWGLLRLPAVFRRQVRAIPTCVGTTPSVRRGATPTAGHPHVCGDYINLENADWEMTGPSPRAWGLRAVDHPARRPARAIPTCVGTTLVPGTRLVLEVGPSPRVWGLRGRSGASSPGTSGHPHVRGDYRSLSTCGHPRPGPSPRAWGLRSLQRLQKAVRPGHPHVRGDYGVVLWREYEERAIPTCVGTTGAPGPP